MSPAVDSKGRIVYAYPYLPGTETQWAGWNYGTSENLLVADQCVRFLADAVPRLNVNPFTFDFDRDPATLARALPLRHDVLRSPCGQGARRQDRDVARSGRCRNHGLFVRRLLRGRHEDDGRPPAHGGLLSLVPDSWRSSLRRRTGPDRVRWLTLLENWVEKGQAPDVLIASRLRNGVMERSRLSIPRSGNDEFVCSCSCSACLPARALRKPPPHHQAHRRSSDDLLLRGAVPFLPQS
jgi:hypothetical protein